MDAVTVWTIVGSVAGVISAGAAFLQLRQGRRRDGAPARPGTPGSFMNDGTLPPPVGDLPAVVRGRDELVEALAAAAAAPDGRVHVLAGLGGCGKSTVALAVARRCREAGQTVWWLPAVDRASVTGELLGLARVLGASDGELADARAGRASPADVLWRQLETAGGWVLILDNADDPAVLAATGNTAGGGAGWLRPTKGGLVLVTSRTVDTRAWGPLSSVHAVESLGVGDGAQVLLDLAPGAGDGALAGKLAARLGGLPLALQQAGIYLSRDFAAERDFETYGRALDDRFGELLGRGDDDRATVAGTWELSLGALAAQGMPQARELLQVLSCFAAATPVPPSLLDRELLGQRVGGQGAAGDGLGGLLSLGLIQTRSGHTAGDMPAVQVHPLVAETVRHRADEALATSFCVAVGLLDNAAGGLSFQDIRDRPAWLALLPHLQALLEREVTVPAAALEGLARVAREMAEALRWGGAYLASFDEVAGRALERVAALGTDHQQVLALRSSRASANAMLGRWAEAEAEFREVLGARSRTLGPEHADTLGTRHMHADVLVYLGNLTEAASEFAEVLAARRKVLGPEHRDTLDTWHEAMWVLQVGGRHAEAEAGFRQVLAVQLRVLGQEHRDTLHVRHHIASVYAALGKPAAAEAEFREILAVQLRVLGPDHADTHTSLEGIGEALTMQGRDAEAEAQYRQALETRLRILGSAHPDTLITRHNLGCALRSQGKNTEAVAELEQVLTERTQTLGLEHPDTRQTVAAIDQAMDQAPPRAPAVQ